MLNQITENPLISSSKSLILSMTVNTLIVGLLCLLVLIGRPVWAASNDADKSIHIAVAANFLATLRGIAREFNHETGIEVNLSSGATGMLYAQIQRGAPYDLFFAADSKRPEMLEQQGKIEPNSRFSYVRGKLVAWSPDPDKASADLEKLDVNNPELHFMAIANPKTAPYGVAAIAVLKHYGLYQALQQSGKLVQGNNVGKTYHYLVSGNAQIGLIAKSYVANPENIMPGQIFDIDDKLYPPLLQQAVVLKGRMSPQIKQFIRYFKSDKVQQRIEQYGYALVQQ